MRSIVRDPFFWALIVVVVFAGIRAINTGIALRYDAETTVWYISEATFPILSGSIGDSGFLPFATAVAGCVILQACRHSLGRAARMAFLLISSTLAGLAAVLALVAVYLGAADAHLLSVDAEAASFAGLAFGVHLIGGTVALVAAFEQRWTMAFPFLTLALGGSGAGLFAFNPPVLAAAVFAAELIMLAYSFAFSCRMLQSSGEFKLLVAVGISFTLGGLLIAAILPESALAERLAACRNLEFFPERYWLIRDVTSAVAFKSWISHLWIGTGLSSFPLDFRFNAPQDAWTLLPRGIGAASNGWWFLLAERGLVGMAFFALPVGFLIVTYVRRSVGILRVWELPHPACLIAPVALALFVAVGFYDCSPLRSDVLMAMGALMAISSAAFPRVKGGIHG